MEVLFPFTPILSEVMMAEHRQYKKDDVIFRFTLLEDERIEHYNGASRHVALCRCTCGVERLRDLRKIKDTKTCQCTKPRKMGNEYEAHGESGTRLYGIWHGMQERCRNPNYPYYENYGGRGIYVCTEWARSFVAFRDWAHSAGYEEDLTIERKDVNDHYHAGNCTWIPNEDQQKNTTRTIMVTAFGETKPKWAWEKDPRCKVGPRALRARLENGMDPELAMTEPLRAGPHARKTIEFSNPEK